MNRGRDLLEAVEKPYSYKLVLKCLLIFLLGAAATALILYLSLNRETAGSSYGESYKMMAALKGEILHKSLLIYLSASFLITVCIMIISLVYSHRVAGPLYRLEMFARKIAAGDLTESVRLRQNDVIHPLADDFNSMIARYKEIVDHLDSKVKDLRERTSSLSDASGAQTDDDLHRSIEKVSETIDEIREILSQISL